ncbi:YgjV family protein [Geomesophilobacter sediminis]|uniref:YgjV family protein n=1 Tax=Geomesophilobacter sediminis TaxID=2798584 RepID=A0A8J7JL77_9BACT|nr:YgjV family protein [Geomesophilobacter sediminis]MBJ6724580.1 YgjV family protein [Geomesophilobacter sediminis]
MKFFSLAQCLGYLAFVLGIYAFTRKNDRRLKFIVGLESIAYVIHFTLLGNAAAAGSAAITSARSFLAVKTASPILAALVIVANISVGLLLTRHASDLLPVVGSGIATYAMFAMRGIPMRLVILGSTFCWLANNILTGSIGGTLLESIIAVVNLSTVVQMYRTEATAEPA